jgi:DNA-binding NarL/FixJ family response regulator
MPQYSRISVLIAHDDPLISAGLEITLQEHRDFEAVTWSPALASRATASHLPTTDVVIADYDAGLRLVGSAAAKGRRVIVLTQHDSEAKICHALERGVRGYLLLGCTLKELMYGLRSVHMGGMALAPRVASRIADRMRQRALTGREEDILRQMMLGLSNKAIAGKLTLAVGTVKAHIKSVFAKLHAASRTEAVAIAQRRGILREEYEFPPPEAQTARIGKRSGAESRACFGYTPRKGKSSAATISFL